jgi:hypothetical protein
LRVVVCSLIFQGTQSLEGVRPHEGIEAENVRVRIKGGRGRRGRRDWEVVCVCVSERERVWMWTTAMGRLGRSSGGGGGAGGHVGSGEEWWGCRKLRWVVGVGKNGGAVENFVGLV